jgi:hypothetical protein
MSGWFALRTLHVIVGIPKSSRFGKHISPQLGMQRL